MKSDTVALTRTPTVKLPANSTTCDEVTDICHQICLAHGSSEDIRFHVSDDNRLYCVQGTTNSQPQRKKACILPHTPCLLSLDGYLTSARRKLLDRKRIELAIKLACSILQYNETPWFARGWRKEHIYFFEDPMTGAAIDVDHPLISNPFSSTPGSTIPSPPTPTEPHDTLLDLAVLLMELYHRTTFEDWTRQNYPFVTPQQLEDTDWKRVYATKWYRAAMPRDADFRGVVSVCLAPHPLEQFESSWEDENFRCAFYEHVVAPLLIF